MSSQLKNDIDNALQGVLHALIERHISRDEAMERLRGIVAGMMPKQTAEVYSANALMAAFIDAWVYATAQFNIPLAKDATYARNAWIDYAKKHGIIIDEGGPNGR